MKSNPALIRVQGHGSVSSVPDTIILGLDLNSEDEDYDKVIADASRRLELLTQAIAKTGLSPELLRTESFNVGVERDYDAGHYTFRAYSVKHSLSLRIPFDQAKLGNVFAAVTRSKARANLSLSFTVSDPEGVKSRVLEAAVKNARSRAEIIASAAGLKLGAIQGIEYGHTVITVSSPPLMFSEACASPAMDINPADIESDDTVLVVWELCD